MKHLVWALIAPGLLFLPVAALADPPQDIGKEARAVLQTYCAGCHGGGKAAKGRFGFLFERDRLVSRV